jgi:hypothetical protein
MEKNREKLEGKGSDRRNFIAKTLVAGAGLALVAARNDAQTSGGRGTGAASSPGRRKLGKLEVSSVGMGVQNMHRRYDTSVPYRPEMINILRGAYDRGITFL